MAKTITGEALKKLINVGEIIENGSIENCGALKYDFVLSEEFLKAEFKSPQKMSDLSAIERRNAIVLPGEVVYVLSKETLHLPKDMYMHLSANRGMSEYGVLTLGGFAVDPGYSGRLMFGLYNYSSTPFTLIPGEKLVGAVFYQFEEDEANNILEITVPKSIDKFPPRLISIIGNYSPTGLTSLEDGMKVIKEQLETLKLEIKQSKDELYELRRLVQDTQEQTNKLSRSVTEVSETVKDLSGVVTSLKEAIHSLSEGLEAEVTLRKGMSTELDKKIEIMGKDINDKIKFIKGASWTLTAIVSIFITLLITWVGGWLEF